MKLLIYNWAPLGDPAMTGGGVSLYLRALVAELLTRADVEIWYLSSGHRYDLLRRRPRITATGNDFDHPRLKTFALVNSPIKAPAQDAFTAVDRWAGDPVTPRLLAEFLAAHGPFDALHLHNLEGIGSQALALAESPHLNRLFYTFHNYAPLCPQVELLYAGQTNCDDFRGGARCLGCLRQERRMGERIAARRLGGALMGRGLAEHPLGRFLAGVQAGSRTWLRAFAGLGADVRLGLRSGFRHWQLPPRQPVGAGASPTASPPLRPTPLPAPRLPAAHYRQWREGNAALLRQHATGIFAVSELCRQTALDFLPEDTRVETLRLPGDIAPLTPQPARRDRDDLLTLSFLGYDSPAKGLPFLIEALSDLVDPFIRDRVRLLIVSRPGELSLRRLSQLQTRFREIRLLPGYARSQLPALAAGIDLNIVPSLWRETFNLVTVELARLGVPSLVSSTVGAGEALARPEPFTFASGDAGDLRAKLVPLLRDAELRAEFFAMPLCLPTMTAHADLLLARYAGQAGPH